MWRGQLSSRATIPHPNGGQGGGPIVGATHHSLFRGGGDPLFQGVSGSIQLSHPLNRGGCGCGCWWGDGSTHSTPPFGDITPTPFTQPTPPLVIEGGWQRGWPPFHQYLDFFFVDIWFCTFSFVFFFPRSYDKAVQTCRTLLLDLMCKIAQWH